MDVLAMTKVKPFVTYICRRLAPKAPEILLGVGIAAIGGGTVVACVKSVNETPGIISSTKEEVADVRESIESEEDVRKEVAGAYLKMGIEMAKVYAIPVTMIGAGVGCIIASHNIQHGRIVAIGTAYNTLLTSFNEYRDRVRAKEGDKADKSYLYGEEETTVVEEKTDKNGKVTEKEKKVTVLGSGDGESLYHRRYDVYSSSQWCNDIDYNLAYLMAQERIFNNELHAKGYVMLDEVYEALGFSLDGYSNAKIVGWMLGLGDDHIDFGLYNPNADFEERLTNLTALKDGNEYKRDDDSDIRMNGFDNAIWLDFNCDGIIIDKI